jgi:FdhD protein
MRSLRIVRIQGGLRETVEELLTEEVTLKLYAGDRRIASLLCSPADLQDLVLGFLFGQGVIERAADVRAVTVNRATWSAFLELAPELGSELPVLAGLVGSGCGSLPPPSSASAALPPLPADGFRVRAGRVSELMQELARLSEVHRRTGGVHGAALADAGGIRLFREDIGRHNAVDKVIGARLAAGGGFQRCLLLSSGRVSSEVLAKAARCRVPVLVSRTAPTDRSVEEARRLNLTLAGFARGERMNLYSAPERITGE